MNESPNSFAPLCPGELASTTLRILVVDDDVSLSRLLRTILRVEGYEVLSAGDGQEALEVVEREHVDLIVLDLQMPRMDGRSFFRALRSTGNNTPVLIASAYGARSTQLELGADGSIEKPFDPDRLVDLVGRLLPKTSF